MQRGIKEVSSYLNMDDLGDKTLANETRGLEFAPLQLHQQGDVITANVHRMQLRLVSSGFYFYAETVSAL